MTDAWGVGQGSWAVWSGLTWSLLPSPAHHLLQMGSRCPCRRWSHSRTAPGMRPPASGSARAWRCACARWRRRTVRCGGSSAWHRAVPQPTATATTPRPTPWKRVRATARTFAPASWLATALSAGSSRSWRSVR